MNIYVNIDAAGYVDAWGSSLEGDNIIALDTTENPFEGKNFRAFKWDGEKLVYDQSRQDALIAEYEANRPSPIPDSERIKTLEQENDRLQNSVAFLEDMIVILTMP